MDDNKVNGNWKAYATMQMARQIDKEILIHNRI